MLLPIITLAAFSQRLRRLRRDRSGSAAVEFAMIAPIFFALIFAIMETGLVFLAGQVLETGVQDGARAVYTNKNVSAADFKTPICARVAVLLDCTKLDVDVRTYNTADVITPTDPIDASGKYVSNGFVYQPPPYSESNPPDVTVVVRGFYQWPLFVTGLGYNIANVDRGTTAGKRLLAATAAVRPQ